jgi:hypothetical protein
MKSLTLEDDLASMHQVSVTDVVALYQAELAKHERDDRSHGALDLKSALVRATRTMVHAKLQELLPVPPVGKREDPDDAHARQKAHGKALWREADRLVNDAKLEELP